ncbi:glycosyltransferase subunit STT3A [Seminavis robusta]|uniref:dolichyl-diphosphooligosaccharide--protein glycotransferase n=1 Tax=Seminavis robusta TaxID=568900 RepID=A0A9N8HVK2_9STRA|nr:glycosyltransferase subunit STT3A [Seminavis robusta]|eukprot:Sro1959_g307920.1 glycosyltransferase subunit STT3A (968) ;mRNA; f:1070-4474
MASSLPKSASEDTSRQLMQMVWIGALFYAISVILNAAYRIRMHAIEEYGPVIHEFDPYFNYRATEYLAANGMHKFFHWFDYKVWYPLGRPVGTTIYPGMQVTAVAIHRYLLSHWSLNDVCCYMPAWFGAIATLITGLLAYEASLPQNTSSNLIQFLWDIVQGTCGRNHIKPAKSNNSFSNLSPALECAVFAMAMMSIVPAHLMRSVGGGFDNESVATTAMILTFYCWMRSLRNGNDVNTIVVYGCLTGLSYFYMVATWGGFVFVLNLIGVHAAMLVGLGRFSDKVWLSYSLFYSIGTLLAIQVPVVGWAPLRSLEQLGPCGVFLGYQVLQFCEVIRRRNNLSRTAAWKLRIQVCVALAGALCIFAFFLAPSGYFGPISSRVRGLFVQHTKTGNPLVDSVAEHQPASSRAYFQYLHHVCSVAPIGYVLVMCNLSDSSSFLIAWGAVAYFFSHKMVRLILLTAPIGSVLGGIAAGRLFSWCLQQWWESDVDSSSNGSANEEHNKGKDSKKSKKTKKNTPGGAPSAASSASASTKSKGSGSNSFEGLLSLKHAYETASKSKEGLFVRRTITAVIVLLGYTVGTSFTKYCWRLSKDLSNPSIIIQGRLKDGRVVKVDDYREAYWWLRDNTPEDARIMAWWDYGYQITGISNRTTIADGNTWNHEHIALLGLALTTDIDEGYEIARHLADYVLVWGGGGGDDLAKSPHLARIANSVYREHCPGDPSCRAFGVIDSRGTASPMMKRSLLYHLHGHQIRPGVEVDPEQFQEVYRSKYGKVRIFKIIGVSEESKAWVADPTNKLCDVPGSWFCPGQYPPALSTIIGRKKDFAQLEDFNRGAADEEYQRQYFESLQNPKKASKTAMQEEMRRMKDSQQPEEQRKRVDEIYNTWADTEETTLMWRLITNNQVEELRSILAEEPTLAFVRSKDGRGPMWWAFEQRHQEITTILMKTGVPHTDRDAQGLAPADLLTGKA